jgi:hypothetical protein
MKKYKNCGNCRYWTSIFDYERGMCKINPSTPDGFPSTLINASCGKFFVSHNG